MSAAAVRARALWGLALVSLTVGYLTLMTSSFLAMLFDLGADYGIFTSSRMAEERRRSWRRSQSASAGPSGRCSPQAAPRS